MMAYMLLYTLRPELSIYGNDQMITPNFERLAKKSVVFDYAFAQIAVCNPSRDSMLTGLRPDTVGTYGFQSSFRPHVVFPQQLARSGYNTAGYGKILHFESDDRSIWNYDSWENHWYQYQGEELSWQNSSTMPDKYKKEEDFRDYQFASRAIEAIKELHGKNKQKHWMVGVGFKLPHLSLHVPFKYFDMYDKKGGSYDQTIDLKDSELRFPLSSPEIGYKCCAADEFVYQKNRGSEKSADAIPIGDINQQLPDKMHQELIMTYSAGISFLDAQLGRILDVMDEKNLWDTTTVILTSDHGMHNGEKGMWEKWTLFEETTRVPLVISHPKSPFKGTRYSAPVELIDIYPTMLDLVAPPYEEKEVCHADNLCPPLQGKSLAGIILGEEVAKKIDDNYDKRKARPDRNTREHMERKKELDPKTHQLKRNFAITQMWNCAEDKNVEIEREIREGNGKKAPSKIKRLSNTWIACDHRPDNTQYSVMGYSIRTPEWRYTAHIHFDKRRLVPYYEKELFDEELYDHRDEKLQDYTHQELENLAYDEDHRNIVTELRGTLYDFLKSEVDFKAKESVARYDLGGTHATHKDPRHKAHDHKAKRRLLDILEGKLYGNGDEIMEHVSYWNYRGGAEDLLDPPMYIN